MRVLPAGPVNVTELVEPVYSLDHDRCCDHVADSCARLSALGHLRCPRDRIDFADRLTFAFLLELGRKALVVLNDDLVAHFDLRKIANVRRDLHRCAAIACAQSDEALIEVNRLDRCGDRLGFFDLDRLGGLGGRRPANRARRG